MSSKNLLLRCSITAILSALCNNGYSQETIQTTNSIPTTLDKVEVTGSHIRQVNLVNSQPITVLTQADIQQRGLTNLTAILQTLTAMGAPVESRAFAVASGEIAGGHYANLRNLGAQRTLVLMDGKRLGMTANGYADISIIPVNSIERVEVLTSGASAIYGSDAIAGVINIITKQRISTPEFSVTKGQFSQGDGATIQYGGIWGKAWENHSFIIGAEYVQEDPVFSPNRPFSAAPGGIHHPVPDMDPATGKPRTNNWTGVSEWGAILKPIINNDGTFGTESWTANRTGDPRDFANYHPTDLLNDLSNNTAQMALQTGLKKHSVFFTMENNLNSAISIKTNLLYSDRDTEQYVGGYPYQSKNFATPMSADSYFNPLGIEVDFTRRAWEVPRFTLHSIKTYRINTEINGEFNFNQHHLDWQVGYLYHLNKGKKQSRNNLYTEHVNNAVGPSFKDNNGIIRCGNPSAIIQDCVPWNPLAPYGMNTDGALTNQALMDYLFIPTNDNSRNSTDSIYANISGDIFTLPAGNMALALGIEHRTEQARFIPDRIRQQGLNTDPLQTASSGKYSLDEAYLELNIPILSNQFLAKEFDVNLASRYSNYDSFGDTLNYQVGLKWKPIDSLLIRGGYSTGFRAPTISDLYGSTEESFRGFTDPCDRLFGAATRNHQVAERCRAAGLNDNYRQQTSGGILATAPNAITNYAFLSGSNPGLEPETSKSTHIGIVYSPEFLEGLELSVDWWKIRIDNIINTISATSILNHCYIDNIARSCTRFKRLDNGQIGELNHSLINAGYRETAGYDMALNYQFKENRAGKFSIVSNTSYSDYIESKTDSSLSTVIKQENGWNNNFRVRSNIGLHWNKGAWGVAWTTRYYSSVKEACMYDLNGGSECNLYNFVSPYTGASPTRRVGANSFHDIQIQLNTVWNANILFGINNVGNHYAANMYSKPSSAFPYYGGFDIGRFLYIKYNQKF